MVIVNIRGTSGSGKSTLVHRFLQEHPHEPIKAILSDWKKEKVVAYKCNILNHEEIANRPRFNVVDLSKPRFTYVMGRYETQCGGWDSMSYKGSHEDLQQMIDMAAEKGNVIFEGLTVSSSYGRWLKISQKYPGQFVWAFMDTPEEVCYQRILARSGREPKRDANGSADYNRKYHGCEVQSKKLIEMGEKVIWLSSDTNGYQKLLEVLN